MGNPLRRASLGFFVAVLLVLSPTLASAQTLDVGVKGGVNIANVDFEAEGLSINFERRFGGIGGVFVGGDIAGPFGLQVEALLSQKGTKTTDFDFDEDGAPDEFNVRVDYIEVPVLARVGFDAGSQSAVHLYAGPAFAFKARETQELNGVEIDEDLALTSNDLGVTIGLGVTARRFVVDARYTHGLRNINDDDDADEVTIKNKTISVMVGFALR